MHKALCALMSFSFGLVIGLGGSGCAASDNAAPVVSEHARGVTRPPTSASAAAPVAQDDEGATDDAHADSARQERAREDAASSSAPMASGAGAVTTLREGDGPVCEADSLIWLRYEGRVVGGGVFDATDGDTPVGPWPVAGLIPGLRDSLIGALAGARLRVVIPPEAAYGDTPLVDASTGEVLVPADATVEYTVELVEVINRSDEEPADG